MAISNLNLNVTANTARALADFQKFSRSLDNKFLVSGLKLDVIRSALSQINREFTAAIGEQGLASASSLRAAQNQAALLTQTFKGFAAESALAINRDIGTALNTLAIKAGGSMNDVKKVLSATPFISTRIGNDLRDQLTSGLLEFQKNTRRAGLGDNFGGMAQQFLSGQAMGMDLINSGSPMGSFLGSEIIKRSGGAAFISDPRMRSEILAQIVGDKDIQKTLREMAKSASGYKIILEDLGTQLFNTEKGVFGSLRKVVDKLGNQTTMFDEVYKLVDQIFGPNGMFKTLFGSIAEVFKVGDPLRPFVDAIQFVTNLFKQLTAYFNSENFKGFLGQVKFIFDRIFGVFKGIYDQIRGGSFDPSQIETYIREIGSSLRENIQRIGKIIRGEDVSEDSGFLSSISGTLFEEVGRTTVVLIKELLMTLIDKVPEIAQSVLPNINRGINGILTEAFGEVGAKIVKFIAGFIPGVPGMIARASAAGDVTGGGGNMGSMLAMGAAALLGPRALFGAARLGRGLFGPSEARMGLLNSLTGRANSIEEIYNSRMRQMYMPGAQRVPLSGLLANILSPRTRFASPVGPFSPQLNYLFSPDGPSSPLTLSGYSSVLAGRGPYTPPSSPLFQNRFGRITAETSMFRPYYNTGSRINAQTTMFRPPDAGELFPYLAINDPLINPKMRAAMEAQQEALRIERQEAMIEEAAFRRKIRGRSGVRSRFAQRYGRGALLGSQIRRGLRGFRGFGRGAALLGAGALGIGIIGGGGVQAATLSQESLASAGSVLSGGFEGAMLGATIGSIVPGVGTAAGAVVGGIIGGIASLMDKGTREGVKSFVEGVGTWLSETQRGVGESLKNSFTWLTDQIWGGIKNIANVMIFSVNTSISALTTIPRAIVGLVKMLPIDKIPGAAGALNSLEGVLNSRIPNVASNGINFIGPALAQEARNSGRRPLVVNDGEFVIPNNGFSTLSNLVGQNIKTQGIVDPGAGKPVMVNIALTLNTNSVVANADELASALKEPVFQIIDEAWKEVTQSNVRRARTA